MRKMWMLIFMLLFVIIMGANADNSFALTNNGIANQALSHLGQNGGQCKPFLQNVVAEQGDILGAGYRQCYLNLGFEVVNHVNATRGDIIQIYRDSNPENFETGMHTAIILDNNGNGTFDVVDSNWISANTVGQHLWNPYAWASGYGLHVHIFRIGGIERHNYTFPSHSSQGWTTGFDTEVWQGNDWNTWQVHITGFNPGIVSPAYNDGMIAEYTKIRFSARVLGNDVSEQAYLWFLDEIGSWNNRAEIGIIDTSHDYRVYEVDLANSWGSSPSREIKQISLELTDGGNGNDEYWTLDWLEIVSTDPGFAIASTNNPYKPENLVATGVSTSQINLSWDRGLNPPPEYQSLQYRIYRDNTAITTTSNTSFSDTSLNSSTQYCYQIAAIVGSKESEKSDIDCSTTFYSGGGGGGRPDPPTANFTADITSGYTPLTVQFSDSSVGAINSWSWVFGDGNNSAAENPVHTYSSAGTYQVELTVNGPDGSDQEVKTGYITVTDEPSPPPTGQPDLVVTSLTLNIFSPNFIRYSYTITNAGTAPANLDGPTGENYDNVSVQAFISEDEIFNNYGDTPAGGTILGPSPLGELAPGESFTGSWYCSLNNVDTNNSYFLTLMADWGEAEEESDESNNTIVTLITLSAPSNLAVDEATNTQIGFSWQNVQYADYYKIYRNGEYLGQTSLTSYIDSNVVEGAVYSYTVTVVNDGVVSTPSEELIIEATSKLVEDWNDGNLDGWSVITSRSIVQALTTDGNPGGYLYSIVTATNGYYVGAKNSGPDYSGNLASQGLKKVSADIKLIGGGFYRAYLRFRYKSSSYNGWKYTLAASMATGQWNTYAVEFNPNWTDEEAIAAGWIQESYSPSFAETMSDVYYTEIKIQGWNWLEAGIDNLIFYYE